MTGPDHYRKAEELTAKAHDYLGRGEGQDSAAVWATVAEIHAALALAAATRSRRRAWRPSPGQRSLAPSCRQAPLRLSRCHARPYQPLARAAPQACAMIRT